MTGLNFMQVPDEWPFKSHGSSAWSDSDPGALAPGVVTRPGRSLTHGPVPGRGPRVRPDVTAAAAAVTVTVTAIIATGRR